MWVERFRQHGIHIQVLFPMTTNNRGFIVGNQFAYDKYRDLRLEKNLAQENLQNTEQSDWSSPGWEVWGPWQY